jgi:hypothetical protein
VGFSVAGVVSRADDAHETRLAHNFAETAPAIPVRFKVGLR